MYKNMGHVIPTERPFAGTPSLWTNKKHLRNNHTMELIFQHVLNNTQKYHF